MKKAKANKSSKQSYCDCKQMEKRVNKMCGGKMHKKG